MSTKRVFFDFWRVTREGGAPPFATLLESALAIVDLPRRVISIGAYPVRFEIIEHADGFWTGEITKFRDDVVPNRASLRALKTPIRLRRDESTTEDTAFGYHVASNTLVTQANHFGSSAGQIVDYFAELLRETRPIFPEPILSQEGWARLDGLSRITKFVYAFVVPPRLTPQAAADMSVEQTIGIVRHLGGRRVRVEVSVGHSADGLAKSVINRAARVIGALVPSGRRKPTLEVSGIGEDDEREVFDLLEYRIRRYVDIEIVRRPCRMPDGRMPSRGPFELQWMI